MGVSKILRIVSAVALAIYFCGLIIALGGLSKAQDWCHENLAAVNSLPPGTLAYTLIAHEPGPKCDRLYRFPILIWAFSVLPFLLSLLHLIKPSLVKRGSAPLFAFAAVLQVFATNTFHDLTTNLTSQTFHTILVGNYVRIVGFAFLAAMSLLLIVLESFMEHDEGHAHRTAASNGDAVGGKITRADAESRV